jgi:redox-sensing transcriptional repressor
MNKDMIQRLTRYKSVLVKLKSLGFIRVFSDNIGDAVGISSALVRKDFSIIAMGGHRRGGYAIDDLITRLNSILGEEGHRNIIVIGCGKIGTALINYNGFARESISVVAGFDIRPDRIGQTAPVPIYSLKEMPAFVQQNQIQIAVLAIPEDAAAQVLEALILAGIKGVLNFAPVQLRSYGKCAIQNINIAMEIESLFHTVRLVNKDGEGAAAEGSCGDDVK